MSTVSKIPGRVGGPGRLPKYLSSFISAKLPATHKSWCQAVSYDRVVNLWCRKRPSNLTLIFKWVSCLEKMEYWEKRYWSHLVPGWLLISLTVPQVQLRTSTRVNVKVRSTIYIRRKRTHIQIRRVISKAQSYPARLTVTDGPTLQPQLINFLRSGETKINSKLSIN